MIDRAGRFVVAVIQASPVSFDPLRTVGIVALLAAQAAERGARFVLFPEGFVGGYPKGMTFGAYVGGRSEEGREQFARYWRSALDVPGDIVAQLGEVAARHRLVLVIGVIERDRGTLYCSVLFFAEDGALIGKHRKLMPTGAERLIWGFGDGSTMPVLETPVGRVGAVICWENYMPMMRMAMYAKGIEIYCAPTADPRPCWTASMQHIAIEGRCFVLACNQFLRRSDLPKDYPAYATEDPTTIVQAGGSCIVDPFGTLLAGPNFEGEAVLTAEIDLGQIPKGKYDLDVVGHYARSDVFRLLVDERPKSAVTWLQRPARTRSGHRARPR
jgi:nitrilase